MLIPDSKTVEIKEIQSVLLSLLLEFDDLCKKHKIKYFLGGGTLLGAVRHQGFIPWDDDIDVMMLREDYDRFCALPKEQLPSHLFIQTHKTDPFYHGDMAKLRINDTVYNTEFSSKFPMMHNGVFIDVFAHDKTSNFIIMQKLHCFFTKFARSAVYHKWDESPMHFYGKYKILCKIATFILSISSICFLENMREFILTFYKNRKTNFLYDGIGQHLDHGVFPEEWLRHSIDVSFEGRLFPAPSEYDKYLKFSYGDYMKIPSASERKLHNIKNIDLGQYYTNSSK